MEIDKTEVILRCECGSEFVGFEAETDEGMDDIVYMSVYKQFDHEQTFKSRLKDIWGLLRGKAIVGYDIVLSKKELKNKVKSL